MPGAVSGRKRVPVMASGGMPFRQMTTRVNFHTHSTCSDGGLTPESLATRLARDGIRYAALTDHDSVEGLARFRQAARNHGMSVVSGIELTVSYPGRTAGEMHLLAYGFDPANPEFAATLHSLRQARTDEIHGIAQSMRRSPPAGSAAPDGILPVADAIAMLHRAGARVFLAHPLAFESDLSSLDAHLGRLVGLGLDGVEAVYSDISASQHKQLCALAEKHNLLVCAGTDLHDPNAPGFASGIDFPHGLWLKFRQAVLLRPEPPSTALYAPAGGIPKDAHIPPGGGAVPSGGPFTGHFFLWRILLPTVLAIGLFLTVIWGVMLPSFKATLLERQRGTIRELTNAAWSILASHEADERAGLLTRAEAQARAQAQIEALRYGPNRKDYFWLQDMTPRIVMHPYRTDLNGQDVSGFTDPNGVRLFVEFADLVRERGEGYLDYVWQWQDDPQRLEPKESFVKGFQPWGWIIGTGIYLDEVHAEIARIEGDLARAALWIGAVMVVLLGFVVQQSLRIERQRREVEAGLRQSTERFHALVEATTEGTLLVLGGRCRYANPTFLRITGYSLGQLEFLDLEDVLPREPENAGTWRSTEGAGGGGSEGVLRHANGRRVDCLLAINRIRFAEQDGWILLARELAAPITDAAKIQIDGGLVEMVEGAPLGMFRARAARNGAWLHWNRAARALIPESEDSPSLADLFADAAEFEHFMRHLREKGEIRDHLLRIDGVVGPVCYLSLCARFTEKAGGRPAFIDGTLADVTAAHAAELERAEMVERLQTSLLFLHEPVGPQAREVVTCFPETPVPDLAAQMTAGHSDTALVCSESGGLPIGIVTDHDLRARALVGASGLRTPAGAVMSAPILRIDGRQLIYEALMQMEAHGVQHLAVEDPHGRIAGVVDYKALIQFQRYGAIVLTRQIMRAASPADVAAECRKSPQLIQSLLNAGARPRWITRVLAGICDAATVRLIELAVRELGAPPAEFAFLAMGSQGRQEQTLLTDQDNGIVYKAPPGGETGAAEYFLRLGTRVSDGLALAGFEPCVGGVMASQPRWCRSLAGWKDGFEEWVRKPEPQELIDFSIFFDLRAVYGDAGLAVELRSHIHAGLSAYPGFFPFFTRNALSFKPPFRLPGGIFLGGGADHSGQVNLKDVCMPIVSFARLYALRHQMPQTHTLERLDEMVERGILLPGSRDDLTAAYDLLIRLRLKTQVALILGGSPASNSLQHGKLSHIEKEMLRQVFLQISAAQKKAMYDFRVAEDPMAA